MHSFVKCPLTVQYLHWLERLRATCALNSADLSKPAADGEVCGVVGSVSGAVRLSGAVQLPYTIGRGRVMSVP